MPNGISTKNLVLVQQNRHCCICGSKKSAVVCRTCEKENKLAGFCYIHMQIHNTERTHDRNFRKIQKVKTVKRLLYGDLVQ